MNDLKPSFEDEEVELGEITGSVGFLLRMAQLKAFDFFFRILDGEDLRPGEFTVLWVISLNPEMKQGSIARCLRIKPAHMTKLVARLVDQGLIDRSVPEDDRRSVRLSLSAEGEAFVERYRDDFLHLHLAERDDLTDEEAAALIRLLRRYADLDGETPCH